MLKKLKNLNTSIAPGPDDIGNWILRKYTKVLTLPITHLLNASYKEQKLPRAWKQADITPIPKEKPVSNIRKHLRPISLFPLYLNWLRTSKMKSTLPLLARDVAQDGGYIFSAAFFAQFKTLNSHNFCLPRS